MLLVLLLAGTTTPTQLGASGPAGCPYTLAVSADPTAGAVPLVVLFNATVSAGTVDSYNWSFGDGSVWNTSGPGAATPTHRYATDGSFNATVTIDEGGCRETAFVRLAAVSGPLSVVVQAHFTPGNAPLKVVFNASVSGGSGTYVSADWNFGDGSVGSGLDVTYTYEAAGSYTAQVNVTDSAGHWSVGTVAVTVGSRPAPGPSPWADVPTLAAVLGVGFVVGGLGAWLVLRTRRTVGGSPGSSEESGAAAASPAPATASAVPGGLTDVGLSPGLETNGSGPAPAGPEDPSAKTVRSGGERRQLTQKVLIHLASQPRVAPEEVAPSSLTQSGIAAAIGVGQNSITNVLRRLEAAGVVTRSVQHVTGRPRRLRVYRLTPRGERIARDVRSQAVRPRPP